MSTIFIDEYMDYSYLGKPFTCFFCWWNERNPTSGCCLNPLLTINQLKYEIECVGTHAYDQLLSSSQQDTLNVFL